MLKELLIFAVVLVALDIGVKFLIAKVFVNKTKSKVKRITSFRLADWHLKQYNKLIKKQIKDRDLNHEVSFLSLKIHSTLQEERIKEVMANDIIYNSNDYGSNYRGDRTRGIDCRRISIHRYIR